LPNKHHLLWFKPGSGKPREFFVSSAVFGLLISLLLVVLTSLFLGVVFYSGITERALERDDLLAENQRLRGEVGRVQRMEAQLDELQYFSDQVRRSLTEGADLERILRSGAEVEDELQSGIEAIPWVRAASNGVKDSLNMLDIFPVTEDSRSFELPDRWPVDGFLTRNFEVSPVDHALSHFGVDIAVPRGITVRAVAAGVILTADWTPRYGNRVIIDHGGVFFSIYGHNELLLVHAGDRVQSGSPIALSGNSGLSTAPHLHFETWVNGRVIDPISILPHKGDENVHKQAG
jgi:murein DD-endopeptidase MepM/ murein hydrolase activator NlpD